MDAVPSRRSDGLLYISFDSNKAFDTEARWCGCIGTQGSCGWPAALPLCNCETGAWLPMYSGRVIADKRRFAVGEQGKGATERIRGGSTYCMAALAVGVGVAALIPRRVTEGATSCKSRLLHRHSRVDRRDSHHPSKTPHDTTRHDTTLGRAIPPHSSRGCARRRHPIAAVQNTRCSPRPRRDPLSDASSSPPATHMLRDTGQIYHGNDKHKDDAS